MSNGKVYLIGAGPGAPDLLTVRAVKILERADIVFHDALSNKEILAYCPLECTVVPVGTRCGLTTPHRQNNIHRLLAEAVQQYTTVVRLKGGDPCIFGRGGEDVEFLISQGIPWKLRLGLVPALAVCPCLAYQSRIVVCLPQSPCSPAAGRPAGRLRVCPRKAVRNTSHTLVFYMAFRYVADIAQDLIKHGKSPDTYAMCASWLSYPQQKIVTAPLAHIGAAVADTQFEAPALLVVGR